MTPRQVQDQIDEIDRRLKRFAAWEKTLAAVRRRYLVEDTNDARSSIAMIEDGVQPGDWRPGDAELEAFDRGMPGLNRTRETIAALKERRALLIEQLPPKAETDAKTKEADALASDIRERAKKLAARVASLDGSVAKLAVLVLDVAEESYRLADANAGLDRLTDDANIARPETPQIDSPARSIAQPLGALLVRHFRGGQPYQPDPNVINQLRAALGQQKTECADVH